MKLPFFIFLILSITACDAPSSLSLNAPPSWGSFTPAGDVETDSNLAGLDGAELPIRVFAYKVEGSRPKPTILLAHGSDGARRLYHTLAQEIVGWGFNAVVIDHYTLRGIAAPHTGRIIPGAGSDDRARDMVAAAKWVETRRWHRGGVGVIGVSQGGGGVFALINRSRMDAAGVLTNEQQYPIRAASTFYPACPITTPPHEPALPTQLNLAEKDDLSWIIRCGDTSHPLYERHVYLGATHAWDVNIPEAVRHRLIFTQRYSPEVTLLSRQRARAFFERHLYHSNR